MFITYPMVLKLIAKRNPREFFGQIRNVMLTAFATSSSNATLPVALKAAEEEVGLPKDVSSFVLTVGATANQNGTALFEGITIIFFCQLFDQPLTAANQLMVLGVSIVAGIGTAGVPGGAWPVIGGIIKTLGVPAGAIGMALGIDRILDMSRTVLNVTGDITIAACVSEWEGRSTAVPESVQG
jgi:DAACS family dicarboxylate/amino acid:cation (Na+ or H+) symporter